MDDQEEKKENLERYFSPVGGFKSGELNIGIYPSFASGKSMILPSLIQKGVLAKPNCIFYDTEAKPVTDFNCVICNAKTPVVNMRNNGFCPSCFKKMQDRENPKPKQKWRRITEDWEISQES